MQCECQSVYFAVCYCAGAVFPELLSSIVVAVFQSDTPVARGDPTASSKMKNREIHASNGNEDRLRESRAVARGRTKRLSNLIPKQPRSKKPKQQRAEPEQLQTSHCQRYSKSPRQRDEESAWTSPPGSTEQARGSPLRTSVSAAPALKARQISHQSLQNLQTEGRFSDRAMRLIAAHISATGCANIIEPYYEEQLPEQHKLYDDLFVTSFVDGHPFIYCADVKELLVRLAGLHKRTIRLIHHGVDSGQGFLKFDLTIEYEPTVPESKMSDHSRHNVILVAILPDVAESGDVFRQVYELLQLPVDTFFHSFHADFKAIAYATGIDGGQSSHPCPYC